MYADYRQFYEESQNEELINEFDFERIERRGISEQGVDISKLLAEVLRIGREECRYKAEMKYGVIFRGDPE